MRIVMQGRKNYLYSGLSKSVPVVKCTQRQLFPLVAATAHAVGKLWQERSFHVKRDLDSEKGAKE